MNRPGSTAETSRRVPSRWGLSSTEAPQFLRIRLESVLAYALRCPAADGEQRGVMENQTCSRAFERVCVLLSAAALSACVASTETTAKNEDEAGTLEIYPVDYGVGISNGDGTQLEVRYDDFGAAGPSLGDTVRYRLRGAEVTLPFVAAPSAVTYTEIDGSPSGPPPLVVDFSHLSPTQVHALAALGEEQPGMVDAIEGGRIEGPTPAGTSERYAACVNRLTSDATLETNEHGYRVLAGSLLGAGAGGVLVAGLTAGSTSIGAILGGAVGAIAGAIVGYILVVAMTWVVLEIYAAASCSSA